jgi:hypothetical protein
MKASKKEINLVDVNVYSPIEDKKIATNLKDSSIWKQAYHEEELFEARKKHAVMFQYTIKFNGTVPTQLTNVKKAMR